MTKKSSAKALFSFGARKRKVDPDAPMNLVANARVAVYNDTQEVNGFKFAKEAIKMDFAVMGTISSYVKQKNLMFAAKHKIRTGQTLTNANGNFISMNTSTFDKLREAAKASTSQAKLQKLARIKRKLRDGQKLSDEELGFLRVNDPKTYKKAKAADDAREELKSELKRAKSKAEAQEILSRALVKASASAMAELGALGAGGANAATSAGGGGATSISGGGEISTTGGEISAGNQISGGEISVTGGEISTTTASENFNATSADENANNFGETSADKNDTTNPNDYVAKKNSDADKFAPEDIMEKFIWTIRALEDEWSRFTNSDAYKNLPERLIDEVDAKFHAPNRRQLNAAAAYRRAMNYSDR